MMALLIFVSLPAPAFGAGEDCDNCIPIQEDTFTGTTADNAPSGSSRCFGDAVNFSDRRAEWYCYTPTCTGIATVRLAADTGSPTLVVYRSCQDSILYCNDGLNPIDGPRELKWFVEAGTTDLIRVAFRNGMGLDYALEVSCETPPAEAVVDVDGRLARLHIPPSYDATVAMPLVVLLHGAGGNGWLTEHYMNFLPLADARGFLYVYPDGTIHPTSGTRRWVFDGGTEINTLYLARLISGISDRYNVDPRRVFLVGYSNGGSMAHRMACDHANMIAAIVSFAGSRPWQDTACAPVAPVHVLQAHGSSDGTVPFEVGLSNVDRWVTFNACGQPRMDELEFQLVAGSRTFATQYADECAIGGTVQLWELRGAGHVPFLSPQFSVIMVNYLLSHPKPSEDCNANGVPDIQDITMATSADCDSNGTPDECEADCNENGIADQCDIADRSSADADVNGKPDECDIGNFDGDLDTDLADFLFIAQCFSGPGAEPDGPDCCRRPSSRRGSPKPPCNSPYDLDRDGDVDLSDVVLFQASFTGSR